MKKILLVFLILAISSTVKEKQSFIFWYEIPEVVGIILTDTTIICPVCSCIHYNGIECPKCNYESWEDLPDGN